MLIKNHPKMSFVINVWKAGQPTIVRVYCFVLLMYDASWVFFKKIIYWHESQLIGNITIVLSRERK